MSKSKIEWTEETWNPTLGCSKVSEGCRNCYAMHVSAWIANMAKSKESQSPVEKAYMSVIKQDENGKYLPQWNNKIAILDERLTDPIRWKKPRTIFVNSMTDLFHPDIPFEYIDRVFAVMAITPRHTYQVLTKRPERMAEYLNRGSEIPPLEGVPAGRGRSSMRHPLPNVWLGTSVENQATAEERIPQLLKCPAKIRFLSCEPLLGPILFNEINQGNQFYDPLGGLGDISPGSFTKIHWVIVGGESGKQARPMHPDWVRTIRDQCQQAGTAFFFKQWGEWKDGSSPQKKVEHIAALNNGEFHPWDSNIKHKATVSWNKHNPTIMSKVGKKQSGNTIDTQTHTVYPQPFPSSGGD